MDRQCYALNSDLELVEKHPSPFVVARLDFKTLGDRITFTEAIAYNEYSRLLAPVYIVEAQAYPRDFVASEPDAHKFNIYRYNSGDWRPEPAIVDKTLLKEGVSWAELHEWEKALRNHRKQEMGRKRIKDASPMFAEVEVI